MTEDQMKALATKIVDEIFRTTSIDRVCKEDYLALSKKFKDEGRDDDSERMLLFAKEVPKIIFVKAVRETVAVLREELPK